MDDKEQDATREPLSEAEITEIADRANKNLKGVEPMTRKILKDPLQGADDH